MGMRGRGSAFSTLPPREGSGFGLGMAMAPPPGAGGSKIAIFKGKIGLVSRHRDSNPTLPPGFVCHGPYHVAVMPYRKAPTSPQVCQKRRLGLAAVRGFLPVAPRGGVGLPPRPPRPAGGRQPSRPVVSLACATEG